MADAKPIHHVGTATPFVTDLVGRHVIPAETGTVIPTETGTEVRATEARAVKQVGERIADSTHIVEPGVLDIEADCGCVRRAKGQTDFRIGGDIKATLIGKQIRIIVEFSHGDFRLVHGRKAGGGA